MPIKTSQYGGRGSVAREMERRRARKRKIEIREELGLSPNASDQEVLEVQRENARAEKELEERREKLRILTGGVALYQLQILLSVAKLNHPRLSPLYSEFLDNDVLDKIGRTVRSKMIQFPWQQSSPPQPLSDLHSMTDTEINDLLNKYKLDTPRARIIKRNDFFLSKPDLINNYSDLYNKIKEGINTKLEIEIINKVIAEDLLTESDTSSLYSSMELKTGFEDAHRSQLMAVGCVAPLEVNFDDPRFIIDLIDMFSLGWDYLMINVVQYDEHILSRIDIYEKLFVVDSRTLWNDFDWITAVSDSDARGRFVRVDKFIQNQNLKGGLERAIHPLLETKIDVLKKNKLGLDLQATSEVLVEKEREYMELLRAEEEAQREAGIAERERQRAERERELERRDRERTEEEATKDPWWVAFNPFSLDGGGQGGGRKTKNKNKSHKRRKTKKCKTKKRKSRRKTKRKS